MTPIRTLVNTAMEAYEAKWGYIWGTSGQKWTQANQDKATRDMTRKYGQKWVGHTVADCSGLFVYAYRQHGKKIYHGSNTIWEKYIVPESKGALAGEIRIRYGSAVFQNAGGKRTHIGWYVGGGMCVEEHGTKAGCILSPLATWDEYGELVDQDYSAEIWETFNILPLDTITKGAKGELVKYLQRALVEEGYEVGEIDGIFGTATLSAVRAFQHDHGLTPDGKVGKKTWTAIKSLAADDEPDEDKPAESPDGAQDAPEESPGKIPLTTEERLRRLELAVFGQEGGESDG